MYNLSATNKLQSDLQNLMPAPRTNRPRVRGVYNACASRRITRRILKLRAVPSGTVLNLRTTTSQNVQRFRGGLVFKAHRLVYHSTLGLIVIKKKKNLTHEAWMPTHVELSFGPRQNAPLSQSVGFRGYRGTSLIRNSPPPRTTIGPQAYSYCRFLMGRCKRTSSCRSARGNTPPCRMA